MFNKIEFMNESNIYVSLKEDAEIKRDLLNAHVVIVDAEKQLLGEIEEIKERRVKIRLLGEFKDGELFGGVIRKPLLDAEIRPLSSEEIPLVLGQNQKNALLLGTSPFYNDHPIYLDVNKFFSNHFAILGNSGSGKSCGTARLIQNVFHNPNVVPYKANFVIFDVSGEYSSAFFNINQINPNFSYRVFTTSTSDNTTERLRIPIWLLTVNDISSLLMANSHSQIPMIEKTLKLARSFSEAGSNAQAYKNHIIAKAIMGVLFSDSSPANKKNDIFRIVESCTTPEFSMETEVMGLGYTRLFRDCFNIDKTGTFTEGILITEYVSQFIDANFDNFEPSPNAYFTLPDFEKALEFTLISDGWFKNKQTYADAMTIKVRLHSLLTGPHSQIFTFPEHVNIDQYINYLFAPNGRKCQILNVNLEDMDDSFAAVITKIFTRIIFDYSKRIPNRGSVPFNILVEEAHRYIKNNDNDDFLYGYNIFNRVAKEGRKYGVMLGVISQRPVELSDTVISQCSNFIIFKTNHPLDVEYIKNMIPNINTEIVEKQKGLQSGTCLGFGTAFKIPVIAKMEMPNPMPLSTNSDVVKYWAQ